MNDRERNNSGQYVETVTTENVYEALETGVGDGAPVVRSGSCPVATTGDVAETLDCSTEAARLKLTNLHEAELVRRRKVGARAVVWWLPTDTDDDQEQGRTQPAEHDDSGGR